MGIVTNESHNIMLRAMKMVANEMILQKSKKGQFFLTIPQSLVEFNRWDKGTVVKITKGADGELVLKAKED